MRVLDKQTSFAKGIDYNDGGSGGDFCQQLTNWRILPNGSLQKRGGSQYIGNSNNPFSSGVVTAGFDFVSALNSNVVTHLVVTDSGTGWFLLREGTHTTWQSSGSAILGQGSFALHSSGGVATEAVFYADGGPLNKYTFGGGLTINLASTPNVQHLAVYNRRLYGSCDSGNPQRVYWSALDDGDSLGIGGSGGGSVDVYTGTRTPITGIAVVGSSLLIFHRDSISRFTGWTQDDFQVDPRGVSSTVGCKNKRTICQIGATQVAFLGNDGIYLSDGNSVSKISDPLQTYLGRQLLGSFPFTVVMAHHPRYHELWVSVPGEDTNGIFAYNLDTGAWSGPHYVTGLTFRPASLWPGYDNLGRQYVTFGNESTDAPVRLDALDASGDPFFLDHVAFDETGGSAFQAIAKVKRFDFGSASTTKSIRSVRIAGNLRASGNTSVQTTTPAGSGAAISLPTVDGDKSYVAFPGGQGPWVDVTITEQGTTGQADIQAVEVEAFVSQRHGF